VPQVHEVDGIHYLIFCSNVATQSESRRVTGAGTGTYYAAADGLLGPFDAASARPLLADRIGSTYAGRLVEFDGPKLLTWLNVDEAGAFVGQLSDPVPVDRDGSATGLEVLAR
jgi:beta-fructofuranosidase